MLGVLLAVAAVQAVSHGATLTAAVATGAAVAVGQKQFGKRCIGHTVRLFTYKGKGKNTIKGSILMLISRLNFSFYI